jgi:hypothetical protein
MQSRDRKPGSFWKSLSQTLVLLALAIILAVVFIHSENAVAQQYVEKPGLSDTTPASLVRTDRPITNA